MIQKMFEDYEKWCVENPIEVPIPCPDGRMGCLVYLAKKEPRKPTYEGFKDWLSNSVWVENTTVRISTGRTPDKVITKTYEYDNLNRIVKETLTEEL